MTNILKKVILFSDNAKTEEADVGKNELFLDKYKCLEQTVKSNYGANFGVFRLEEMAQFKRLSARIKYCRELRNLLVHNSKLNGEWAIEVNDKMIEFVDSLIKAIENPSKIIEYAIPFRSILYKGLGDNVSDTMREMHRCDISKVPILDEQGCVVGIFSYGSVFECAISECGCIDSETVFEDIDKYISIEGDRKKYYLFASPDDYRSTIEEKFDSAYQQHIRIKLVLLTENGKRNSKLLGIVTPWELIDAD